MRGAAARFATCALLLLAGACATPAAAPEPESWGEECSGLQVRATAPSSAAQGDLLKTRVDVRLTSPDSALLGGARIDPDLRTRKAVLELVGAGDGVVEVRPYDPYSGMPPDLDEGPVERIALPGQVHVEEIEFPLATAWDRLPPGDWRCRVRLSYEPRSDGYFRAALVSQEFALRVDAAPAREQVFRLPRTLRDEGGRVTYHAADAEEVHASLRNGFFVGAQIDAEGGSGMTMSLGGVPEPDAANPIDSVDDWPHLLASAYTVTVFETSDAPEHMWHPGPGSGGYRELWRRRIVVATDESRTGWVVVRATTADGAPLAGATIALRRLEIDYLGHRREMTDADGVARFGGLRAGPYRASLDDAPGMSNFWIQGGSEDPQTSARADVLANAVAPVALTAPRFADFDVWLPESELPDGARPFIGMKHLYPGGSWSSRGIPASWGPLRPGDGRIVWHAKGAPEGRYVVQLFVTGRASSTTEVDVRAGGEPAAVRVTPGPTVAPLELVYAGPPLTHDHYFTMSRIDRTQQDVANGKFAGTPPTAAVTEMRPGRAMLTLWRSECAMLVDVPEGGGRIPVEVPEWTAPSAGGTSVTVVVATGGARISRLMTAIAPASDAPLASGKWFRSADAWPGRFEGVAPGEWDVYVFDGVHGSWYGTRENPLVRRVNVGSEPVTVTFDL